MRTSNSSAVQNTFFCSHRFDATTDESNRLLKVLYFVAQKASDTDPVFLGALAFRNLSKELSPKFFSWLTALGCSSPVCSNHFSCLD
jgi:hypothetical protein